MKKVRWADMDDDEPFDLPAPVSRHGVKIAPKPAKVAAEKEVYLPPHKKADKTSKSIVSKNER
jgi:hypothetical protein